MLMNRLDLCDPGEWRYQLKTEDFTNETLAIDDTQEMMLEVAIGVLVMEVDKVADEVTDMEVDRVTDIRIPIEDLTDVILAIGDTYRDYLRSGWEFGRQVELIQVAPPVGQICN